MKLQTLFFYNASSITAPTKIIEGTIEVVSVNDEEETEITFFEGTAEELANNHDDLANEVWEMDIDYLIIRQDGVLRIELV